MKKNVLYLFSLLCTLSFFTACSDDDDVNVVEGVNASFSGKTLDLTYSGSPLLGKKVTFDTRDGQTATITMGGSLDMGLIGGIMGGGKSKADMPIPNFAPGVIPGEQGTTLSNVALTQVGDKYTFEGTCTTTGTGSTVKYAGEVAKDKMTLALDVTVPKNALTGTWNLAPVIPGAFGQTNKSQPIYSVWEADKKFAIDIFGTGTPAELPADFILSMAMQMAIANDMTAHELFLNVLKDVTFGEDGNIRATYSDAGNIKNPEWQNSPLNMAQYCVKDGMIRLYLNPEMIITNLKKNGTKAGLGDLNIMGIITNFLPLLAEGFPLAYVQDGDNLKVYADTEFVLKIFNALLPLLENENIQKSIMDAITKDPAFATFKPVVEAMLTQLPGVVGATSKIELGINLTK